MEPVMAINIVSRRIPSILIHAGTLAFLLGACGGAQQHPETAMNPRAQVISRTNAKPTSSVPNTPTASTVAISDEVLRACNIPDADAYFAFDSSHLTAFDHSALDELATCFIRGPLAGRSMRLVGHADPRGAADYNMTLGQSRADAVATYLATEGMKRTQETTSTRGAMDATGRNETGWAHDRRVDVMLGN
jgi:peptidoglycan-associated lipoprotein